MPGAKRRPRRPAGYSAFRPGPDRLDPPASWVQPIADWLQHLRSGGASDGTVQLRRQWVTRFARQYRRGPWTVTPAALERFLAAPTWRPETRRGARSSLRSFYAWAVETGHLEVSPAERLRRVRVPMAAPRPVPAQVIARALPELEGRVRLAVLLALLAGLRRAEIATLHIGCIEVDRLVITGKGGRIRVVPLHPELATALQPAQEAARERPDCGWIFPSYDAGWHQIATREHISPSHLGRLVAEAMPKGWTLHRLRHSAATNWYGGTHDLLAVQQLLGHSSPTTTVRYVGLGADAARAAVLGASVPGLPLPRSA